MNQTRPLLIFALCVVAFLLWNQWQHEYAAPAPAPAVSTQAGPQAPAAISTAPNQATTSSAGVATGVVPLPAPASSTSASAATAAPSVAPTVPDQAVAAVGTDSLISVDTDVLHLEIDTQGGSVVRAELKRYPVSTDSDAPVTLLNPTPARLYTAQAGLVSADSPVPGYQAQFQAARSSYSLAPGDDALSVDLVWTDPSGIEIHKRYSLKRGSYVIAVEQEVVNRSASAWSGNAYRQLQRVTPPPKPSHWLGFSDPTNYSFFGAGWFSTEEKFEKLKFEDFIEEPLQRPVRSGWIAMLQHYFFAAWIPPATELEQYSTHVVQANDQPLYLIRATAPAFTVAPGTSGHSEARLFIGPKLPKLLESVAPQLDLAVDYGLLTVIAKPLHWVLSKLHALSANWGVAIILLVLLIKLLFFKLSEAQYRSMAKMRKLQPRIQALKERYPDDKSKQQQAMLELYKQEKANPMAGCLPMLVQLPVFFALYYMLMQSVELRQAPFFLWIDDLSAPDPYFVLPILNGAVMLATQWLTPATGMDPTQAKIMKFMPVIFSVMFAVFPAGLVLYYLVNGLLGLIQQWVITRRIENDQRKS